MICEYSQTKSEIIIKEINAASLTGFPFLYTLHTYIHGIPIPNNRFKDRNKLFLKFFACVYLALIFIAYANVVIN